MHLYPLVFVRFVICTFQESRGGGVWSDMVAAIGMQVLTPDNVDALRGSVKTLTKTLEHVEAISGDVGGLTADSRVKANLKQLIEALSRLTVD